MIIDPRAQNPDVNSRQPASDPGESPGSTNSNTDVERGPDDSTIPVPPDAQPRAPIEEPPGTDGPPVGDVDDSPKQIA